ncbi:MAG TPA: PqqD family protein [Candidatus Omnitrophota bacterium]|nr:PqqD family protein [Candidatus Omnitrophota bacterium]HPD84660.1 PqqD family protein [Candidatus Omnitrophota bacterium]HRZ03518.1 PqqD family protein [Candidatus Omnitrophota bacterium]
MNKKQSKRYRIDTEKIVWRTIDGEVVILDLDSGRYYSLNKTGSFAWSLLNENKTGEQIIEKIREEYGLDYKKASQDIRSLIKDLETEGLIVSKA